MRHRLLCLGCVLVCGSLVGTRSALGQFGDILNKAKAKATSKTAPASGGSSSIAGMSGSGAGGYSAQDLSNDGHTASPMPGLEDKIMPDEAKVPIAQADLDLQKNPSKASADWVAVPHTPVSGWLVGADGYQHRPTEGQREAGHLYSIQEQRTFVTNCLADPKGCGTNYGKEEERLASFCGKKFPITFTDGVVIKNIHYSRNVMGDVESMNGVLWSLCQTNKAVVLANVEAVKLITIPAKLNQGSASVGQLWQYDKATKTITIGYPPGPVYNDDRTLQAWIVRNAK